MRTHRPSHERVDQHLTAQDIADGYKVTPRTVRRWIASGELAVIRVGRLVCVKASALRAFEAKISK
jgi:excisionase family DNA binding protein